MIFMLTAIYGAFYDYYSRKFQEKKEEKDWNTWEECELIREEMGHEKAVEKIVRPKTKQPKFKRRRRK